MEIKKGISQMAEYPNAEVNYVVFEDGKMYYVLKNGVLSNGCVIATLDPKRAVDDGVTCNSIGVFKEDGSVLIEFDKKEIKKINEEYLLVVNSIPKTEKVVNTLKNIDDAISKTMIKDNSTTIVDKMIIEMGITGAILFSDAYSEANIYKMDEVNHKIGPDSSFIGKNDNNFYFHTNDPADDTVLVSLTGKVVKQKETGFSMPDVPIINNTPQEEISVPTVDENSNGETLDKGIEEETPVTDFAMEDNDSQSLKLDISQNILGGFKPDLDNKISIDLPKSILSEEDNSLETSNETKEAENNINNKDKQNNNSSDEKDEVLDNVIEVMKKMIEETNKLNEKITELEKQLEEKNEIISSQESKIAAQESKKNELSDLLDEANEVLDNID